MMIHPGFFIRVQTGGGGPAPSPGMKSARYWRIDNIVRHSSGTQIYGLCFHKGGNPVDHRLVPISITTDSGNQTTELNSSLVSGDEQGSVNNMDSITFVDFDFGAAVTPDRLEVWGNEWDVDYLRSFDISWSDDNANWNLIGAFDSDTNYEIGRIWPDRANYVTRHIKCAEGLQISTPRIATVCGRSNNGITLNRPVLSIPQGRRPDAMVLNGPVINVIDKPV